MQLGRILMTLVLAWLLLQSGSSLAQDPPQLPLSNELEVSQSVWLLGEPVQITQTRCNLSDSELVLTEPIQCPIESVHFSIWNADNEIVAFHSPPGPPPFCGPETWQPNECRTSTLTWHQTSGDIFDSAGEPQVPPGPYRASISGGTAPEVEFYILDSTWSVPSLTAAVTAFMALLIAVVALLQFPRKP